MKRLDQARTALDTTPETALRHLLAAWAERPLPELAELVGRFEAAFPPPAFTGSTADFLQATKKPSPAELGGLARAIVAPKSTESIERLAALAAHRTDARVAGALLALVRDVPWTSNGARPVFVKAFELLVTIADPRLLGLAPSLAAGWKFRENQREWMQRQLDAAVEAVGAVRKKKPVAPLTAAEHETVKAIAARLLPASKPKPSEGSKTALLAAVYANPDDDGPRLVLADWLLERGDPWGEFITLQFKADKSKAEVAREAALQAKHGTSWLGALATVVLKDVEFRRGFPSKVVAKFKGQREVEQFGDAPEWATIEELSWSLPGAWTPEETRWHQHVPKHARPKVCTVERFGLTQLLDAQQPWPIESLTLTTGDVEEQKRLVQSSLFPKVRVLRVSDSFAPRLLASGWLATVPSLCVFAPSGYGGKADDFAPFLDALQARDALDFDSRWNGSLHFSKGTDGRLSKVRLTGVVPSQASFLFARLAPGLRGRLTAFEADDTLPEAIRTQCSELVGAAAEPALRERARVRYLAAHPRRDGWSVVRADALLQVDREGAVKSETPINESSVAAFSRDGALVGCAFDRRLEWRDGTTGALLTKEQLGSRLLAISFSRDGSQLMLHCEKQLEVRRWPSRAPRWSLKNGGYPKKPICADVSEDGKSVVATMYNEELRVSREGEKRASTVALESYSPSMAFVSPTTFVVSGRKGTLDLYALDSFPERRQQWAFPESRRIVPSPDGARVVAGPDEAYVNGDSQRVLELASGTLTVLEGSLKVLAWAEDGGRLLCSDGFELVVRDV